MRGSIQRRATTHGSVRWRAVIDMTQAGDQITPRRQVTSTHDTRRQAQLWLAEQATDRQLRQRGPTVGEYLWSWLDGRRSIRASTRRSYEVHIRRHLVPGVGGVSLDALTVADVSHAYDQLRAANQLSVSTLHRVHATLSAALNAAVRHGMVPASPAALVELPPPAVFHAVTWSEQQVQQFLRATRRHRWGLVYRLLLVTGMRRGEVLALRWRDVDLERDEVRVTQQLVQTGSSVAVGQPKSRHGIRAVAIDKVTGRLLREHRLRAGAVDPNDGLFTQPDDALIRPAAFSAEFRFLIQQLGLPTIRLHDLRHTSASLGLATGESLVEVSRRLGHSSVAVTGDVYAHVRSPQTHTAAQRLADAMADTMAGSTPISIQTGGGAA